MKNKINKKYIIIIILLVIIGIVILNTTGVLKKIGKNAKQIEEEDARIKLENAMQSASILKQNDANYNSSEYLTNLLQEQNIIVNGNIISIDGYSFEIDRENLDITQNLGKSQVTVSSEIIEKLGKNSEGKYRAKIQITVTSNVPINTMFFENENGTFSTEKTTELTYIQEKEIEFDKEYIVTVATKDGKINNKTYMHKYIPTIYNITFNGVNVTSNGASSINEYEMYTATLSVKNGYILSSIAVTMGEKELTENIEYTYLNGNLSIPNVSGDIAITTVAEVIKPVVGPVVGGSYDNPYIPAGFTHTPGEGTWNSGYVIRETATGNVFVWVPCVLDQSKVKADDKVETFKKTTTGQYNQYSLELSTEKVVLVEEIKQSVGTYGGFYIAAYEAGVALTNNGKVRSVAGVMTRTGLDQTEALEAAKNMITTSDGVKSSLLSGECWDTTLQWMVKSSTNAAINEKYDIDSTGKGYYGELGQTITGKYPINNIYDMAGNVWEWTIETCSTGYVTRGGCMENTSSNASAATRNSVYWFICSYNLGFRVMLYK